jgi:hypothetical protein
MSRSFCRYLASEGESEVLDKPLTLSPLSLISSTKLPRPVSSVLVRSCSDFHAVAALSSTSVLGDRESLLSFGQSSDVFAFALAGLFHRGIA